SMRASLAAITVSVASSPIFFRIASSPLANSRATYEVAGSPPLASLRASIRSARRFRVSLTAWSRLLLSLVNTFRIFQHRFDGQPFAILGVALELLEKAGMAAGMAGDAVDLFNFQQHHILVAIEPDFMHFLSMTGFFALVPQLLARPAPVHRLAQFDRARQRFAVHPGEHQ